jgi:hypothetical protein
MRLNILCEDSKIAAAREKAKAITGESVLNIPVSKDGKEPATHWFCSLEVNEEGQKKILDLQEHSVIEEGGPKDFLKKWSLKIIK